MCIFNVYSICYIEISNSGVNLYVKPNYFTECIAKCLGNMSVLDLRNSSSDPNVKTCSSRALIRKSIQN